MPPQRRKDELPPNFDPNLALEAMQWACGLAYCPEVGARLQLANDRAPSGAPIFYNTLDGIAFCRIKSTVSPTSGKQLLVSMRGTLFGVIDDMLRNVEGFGTPIQSVFKDGRTWTLAPFAARAHRMYLDRAMGVLFNWLMLEVLKEDYNLGEYSHITVTGHSQGGAVALLFGALVKHLDGEMKKLDFGQSLTVTNWTVSEDIFLRGKASFDLKITRLHQEGKPTFRAEWFMEKGKPASQTRVWEAALLRPDVEFSVYGWAPAKIGNRPFQVWYDALVPNTYSFMFEYDPAINFIFPWTWWPGYLIQANYKPNAWLWLWNLSPWLPGVKKGTHGIPLHGPSPILLSAFSTYLLANGADLSHVWKAVQYFVVASDYIVPFGGGWGWLRIATSQEKHLDDPAFQQRLLQNGGEYEQSQFQMSEWYDASRYDVSPLLTLTMFVLIPLVLLLLSIASLMGMVFLPLLLVPLVLNSLLFDMLYFLFATPSSYTLAGVVTDASLDGTARPRSLPPPASSKRAAAEYAAERKKSLLSISTAAGALV